MAEALGAAIEQSNRRNELARVAEFAAAAQADATRAAYRSDWSDFAAFCVRRQREALPASPETVAVYIVSLADAGRKVSTIRRRLVSIGSRHQDGGHANPAHSPGVRATVEGIERKLGSAPVKKAAMTIDLVAKAVKKIPDDIEGLRDRALILVGFAAALRSSEIVGLDRADVQHHPKGIVLTLRKSKTDQRAQGKTKAIPHGRRVHVAAALDEWIAAAKIADGPLFRSTRGPTALIGRLCRKQVERIVKARAKAIGLDPRSFGSHSLRSGLITSAADSGAKLQDIANHAGHAKLDTTMGYVQVQDAFANSPCRKVL